MRRGTAAILTFLLACVLAAASAEAAQSRSRREEPPPPAPQFKVDGPTRPLAMERIALTVPPSTVLGEFVIHPFCITNAYST